MAMDDVSKISLYTLNNQNLSKKEIKKEETKSEEKEAQVKTDYKAPEKMLSAMDFQGVQNKVSLGLTMINPYEHLTPEQIKSIETSMGVFDSNVKEFKGAIDNLPEFSTLSEESKLQLAAEVTLNSL